MRSVKEMIKNVNDNELDAMHQVQMLSFDTVCALFHISQSLLNTWIRYGVIKCINTGNTRMFSQDEILRVQKQYLGMDLSNLVQIKESLIKHDSAFNS